MQLSPRCFAVTGLAYIPPWSVNAGFIAGEHTTLVVDTGANALAASTIHGYAAAVRPSNRIAVLNTEKHFDHIGGNSYFRDRGAEIHGHALIARTEAEFDEERAEFRSLISNALRREQGEENAFYHDTALANPNRPTDFDLTQDATIELGDCAVCILLTPGHTPTNISAWIPADGVLYCGDCLAHKYSPNLDFGTAPESLEHIERLNRANVPGHGPVAMHDDAQRVIVAGRTLQFDAGRRRVARITISAQTYNAPPTSKVARRPR
jgi:glyoxylase-like metal-dependent hydrolase (beta-lactamase superfamily II)